MHPIKKLNELHATAICGNDITSSCLYVSALTIVYAGQYAWLALLIVAGVLYLFRKIYGEVVGALPLNGGAYNVLLNTTSKSNASVAACLTIRLNNQQFVYFSKADSIASLNKVMMYVHENEPTNKLKIVTVLKEGQAMPKNFLSDLEVLDRAYPEIDIEFVQLTGSFTPALIKSLSKNWNIPVNFMFIASPGNKLPYKVAELGGVRLII